MQYQTKSLCLKFMIIFSIVLVLAPNVISFSYAPAPGKIMHPSYSHIKIPTELAKPHAIETKTHESGDLAEEPVFEGNSQTEQIETSN